MKRRSFFGLVSGLFTGCVVPWKTSSDTWMNVEEAKDLGGIHIFDADGLEITHVIKMCAETGEVIQQALGYNEDGTTYLVIDEEDNLVLRTIYYKAPLSYKTNAEMEYYPCMNPLKRAEDIPYPPLVDQAVWEMYYMHQPQEYDWRIK